MHGSRLIALALRTRSLSACPGAGGVADAMRGVSAGRSAREDAPCRRHAAGSGCGARGGAIAFAAQCAIRQSPAPDAGPSMQKASALRPTPRYGIRPCSAIPNAAGAARPPAFMPCCYLFMPMTVSSMLSVVVMALELAWKPRCVVIMCTNSLAMSTLDCSML